MFYVISYRSRARPPSNTGRSFPAGGSPFRCLPAHEAHGTATAPGHLATLCLLIRNGHSEHPDRSVRGACVSGSQGGDFKPHTEHGVSFGKKKIRNRYSLSTKTVGLKTVRESHELEAGAHDSDFASTFILAAAICAGKGLSSTDVLRAQPHGLAETATRRGRQDRAAKGRRGQQEGGAPAGSLGQASPTLHSPED